MTTDHAAAIILATLYCIALAILVALHVNPQHLREGPLRPVALAWDALARLARRVIYRQPRYTPTHRKE